MPVNVGGSSDNYVYDTLFEPSGSHPILDQVSAFFTGTYTQFPTASPALDEGAALLATTSGFVAAAAGELGAGRSAYLGPIYAGYADGWNTAALRSGDADRLLEQAVSWVAGPTAADLYVVRATAGDTLTIGTRTPGEGDGEPVNLLDPAIDLFDPAGNLVASDDNGDADGRNAALTYTIATTGDYRVAVRSAQGAGDYVLTVSGATGQSAFAVSAGLPADATSTQAYPGSFIVTLSEQVLLTSVQAEDLLIDGTPADGFAIIDGNTLEFAIGSRETGSDHTYVVTIPAGAFESLSGKPIQAFASSFIIDRTAPVVSNTSIANAAVVNTDPLTITVDFNEALDSIGLDAADVQLTDGDGVVQTLIDFTYDASSHSVTLDFGSLREGTYTLALASAADAFRDRAGNLLDGDADGIAGGAFILGFTVDVQTDAYPVPLVALQPNGALVFQGAGSGVFHEEGDVDAYRIDLEAGQVLTLSFDSADAGLTGSVALIDPDGHVVGEVTAATAGGSALLRTAAVATAGTYAIRVRADSGFGSYSVGALLNADFETDSHAAFAAAQDIGPTSSH